TGTGLLLDGLDLYPAVNTCTCNLKLPVLSALGIMPIAPYLHNLILKTRKESVDNLVFLDRERVEVNLFHRLDLASLDEAAELGDGDPLLLIGFGSTAATTSSTAPSSVTTVSTTGSETSGLSSVGHFELCRF